MAVWRAHLTQRLLDPFPVHADLCGRRDEPTKAKRLGRRVLAEVATELPRAERTPVRTHFGEQLDSWYHVPTFDVAEAA